MNRCSNCLTYGDDNSLNPSANSICLHAQEFFRWLSCCARLVNSADMKTCIKCGSVFPSSVRNNGRQYVYSSRRYCLTCSPFKQHKIRSRASRQPLNLRCDLCDKDLNPAECRNRKRCQPCQVKIHRIAMKVRAVRLLGGQCIKCGWMAQTVTEMTAFDFHHKHSKDFALSAAFNKKWESVVSEIEKCELLCARCHRIHHVNRDDKVLAAALDRVNFMAG